MHRTLLTCSVVCLISFFSTTFHGATGVTTKSSSQVVAVLDVGRLLKSDPEFKSSMAKMQVDVQRAKMLMKKHVGSIKKLAETLLGMKIGSPEYVALKQTVTQREEDTKLRIELQQNEFAERESKILLSSYKKIMREVKNYSSDNNIDLVVRVDASAADIVSSKALLRELSKPIVWHSSRLDITGAIAARLGFRISSPMRALPQTPILKTKPTIIVPKAAPKAQPKPTPKPKNVKKAPVKKAEAKSTKPVVKKAPKPTAKKKKSQDTKARSDDKKKAPKVKKPAAKKKVVLDKKKALVVRFCIKKNYPEQQAVSGPFGNMRTTLSKLIRRIGEAAGDKAVSAILLRIEPVKISRGRVNELRQAIKLVRAKGKLVFAELSVAETNGYLLASACDEVTMLPSGMLMIPGAYAEVTFFKGLLDKLGVKADLIQMGKFKGAGEPFTRTTMSPAFRVNVCELIDDSYNQMIETIAKDRKIKDYKVKTLVDKGAFTAADAKEVGLVDHVVYPDEFAKMLAKRLKVDELKIENKYRKTRTKRNLSGFAGFMTLMEFTFGGKKTTHPTTSQKKIAVIYACGAIAQGKSAEGLFGSKKLGSDTIVKALKKAADDDRVLAIVLRVNSPGGSAVASDIIWREIVRIKKPIIASMGDVAASGGYYISMGADKILAEPTTITGSIGVIGGKIVTSNMLAKIGITTEVVSRGENAGALSSTRQFTEKQRKMMTALMKETYRQFVDKAAKGRKMSYEKLHGLAQGRVYTGKRAVSIGLVDRTGTLNDAIAEAKKAAGVKEDAKIELLILPRPSSFFETFFGDSDISTRLGINIGQLGRFASLAQLVRTLFETEPSLTLMPCLIELK